MSFYLSCDWLPHECKANTLWCVISVASRSSALRNDQFYYFFSLRKKIPHDEKTRKHQRVLVSFYSCCDWLPCDCAAILFDASLWSYNNCALWQSTNFIFFSSLKKNPWTEKNSKTSKGMDDILFVLWPPHECEADTLLSATVVVQ